MGLEKEITWWEGIKKGFKAERDRQLLSGEDFPYWADGNIQHRWLSLHPESIAARGINLSNSLRQGDYFDAGSELAPATSSVVREGVKRIRDDRPEMQFSGWVMLTAAVGVLVAEIDVRSPVESGAPKSGPGKYTVGAYDDIRGAVPGLDAHHVGQKAVMDKFVPGYNPGTAPSILVPKVGHTIRGPDGIVSRSTDGFTNAREVVARDIFELRRVYPDVPNSSLRELIDMNKTMYPGPMTKP
jgi:hypothetical protein